MGTPDREQYIGPELEVVRHGHKNRRDGTAHYTANVEWAGEDGVWWRCPVFADICSGHDEAFGKANQILSAAGGREKFIESHRLFAVKETEENGDLGQPCLDSLTATPKHRGVLERWLSEIGIIGRRFTVTWRNTSGAWHKETIRAGTCSQALEKAKKQLV